MRVYRRVGVREYAILLTLERETIWYQLDEGRYVAVAPGADGLINSQAFPGLHFHSDKFWADDVAGLLDDLRAGIATPTHEAFRQTLQSPS